MRLHFHGAARTVTGSQHLIEVNGKRLLLECGLFQGRRAETYERNLHFSFDPRSIDAVILSHAHIDHSGNLPNLVKQGFSGPIYATPATAHLTELMLLDSGHIQESDVVFLNRKRARRGEPPVEPIYTSEDAAQVAPLLRPMPYDQPFEALRGVTACLREAGHILGSAAVSLDLRENGRQARLWFSGDIGRYYLPLLRDPVLPEQVDWLVMESTYGDRPHRDPRLAYDEMLTVFQRTFERGGKVIIPAFAVGRTQELVYNLNQMIAENALPRIPVYVDSPLAVNASDIFRQHPECFDAETHAFIREHQHPALDFKGLHYVRAVDESKALNARRDPMVIISASGMAETGRILHHLRNNIENPNNTIMIVSWQAPYTLGRRLAEQVEEVRIFGESYRRKAQVATIGGLSAHAGRDFLGEYALRVKGRARGVYLVHGEPRGAEALQAHLAERGMSNVHYPQPGESIEL